MILWGENKIREQLVTIANKSHNPPRFRCYVE